MMVELDGQSADRWAPEPGPDEVLVEVRAAALTVHAGVGTETASVEVRDFAGTVCAFGGGDGEGRFVVGEEVYGQLPTQGRSAATEYVVVPATCLSLRPRTVTFAEAAVLPHPAVSAWNALIEAENVQPGQTILVWNGASEVGLYAIQLATLAGATVVAAGEPATAAILRELGAQVVGSDAAERMPADIVFDPARPVAPARADRDVDSAMTPTRGTHRWSPTSVLRPFPRGAELSRPESQLALIADLVDRGGLRPILGRTFPLAAADDARRHAVGSTEPGTTVLVR
jgi:NADPH:quinone reductase-like Zn-dependent oxidoreductase